MSGAMLYTQAYGSRPENVEVPHLDSRNPTVEDINYPVGKRWVNTALNTVFSLTSFSYANLQQNAIWTSLSGFQISSVGTGALVNSTAVVVDSAVVSTSLIFIVYGVESGQVGFVEVLPSNVLQGQFTVTSTQSSTDASDFYYFVVN